MKYMSNEDRTRFIICINAEIVLLYDTVTNYTCSCILQTDTRTFSASQMQHGNWSRFSDDDNPACDDFDTAFLDVPENKVLVKWLSGAVTLVTRDNKNVFMVTPAFKSRL